MADVEEQVDIVEQEEVVEDDAEFEPATDSASDIKLFGKWDFSEIQVSDMSLVVRRNIELRINDQRFRKEELG
jgi:hypothetical protein